MREIVKALSSIRKWREELDTQEGLDEETLKWMARNGRALADQMFRDTVRVVEEQETHQVATEDTR